MNTWKQVNASLTGWLAQGLEPTDVIVKLANACIGWTYVYGARGEQCTPKNRQAYYKSKGDAHPTIKTKCKNFDGTGSCSGCKWYPNGVTLFYDCRGWTYWVLLKAAGIKINGGGATSQWNDNSNWDLKGKIEDMPKDKICCVFRQDGTKMAHTLLYTGDGYYIHDSSEVKKVKTSAYNATHFAIPKGLYSDIKPVPVPEGYATVTGTRVALRKEPATKAGAIITRVNTGEKVKIETPPDLGWDYVSYNGKTGWMMKQFLKEGK